MLFQLFKLEVPESDASQVYWAGTKTLLMLVCCESVRPLLSIIKYALVESVVDALT